MRLPVTGQCRQGGYFVIEINIGKFQSEMPGKLNSCIFVPLVYWIAPSSASSTTSYRYDQSRTETALQTSHVR